MFSREDADTYNERHLSSETNLCTEDMPDNTVVAVKDNKDRDAIHDAMFLKHLEKTHSKDPAHTPPTHTICVLASDMKWRLNHHTYVPMSSYGRDIVYATCSGNLVRTDKGSKCIDPLLKLYDGCVLMVIENIDVDNKIANGAVGKFKEVVLKENILFDSLDTIIIDGYYVRCVNIEDLKHIKLELIEDLKPGQSPTTICVEPKTYYAKVRFPINIDSKITHTTSRPIHKACKLTQFPINLATARTVHKLQGQSIKNIFISSWDVRGNWIYVVLSRCKTRSGMFLRSKLDYDKIKKGMDQKCIDFYKRWRRTKTREATDREPFFYFN